ncbi:Bifunctional purine biosynthetic protein ade1 [Ascosphaera pollenicola]|nr:Bifunctional purine biosynthetic protein ade1 [Ascosphaera pollenicola]
MEISEDDSLTLGTGKITQENIDALEKEDLLSDSAIVFYLEYLRLSISLGEKAWVFIDPCAFTTILFGMQPLDLKKAEYFVIPFNQDEH